MNHRRVHRAHLPAVPVQVLTALNLLPAPRVPVRHQNRPARVQTAVLLNRPVPALIAPVNHHRAVLPNPLRAVRPGRLVQVLTVPVRPLIHRAVHPRRVQVRARPGRRAPALTVPARHLIRRAVHPRRVQVRVRPGHPVRHRTVPVRHRTVPVRRTVRAHLDRRPVPVLNQFIVNLVPQR